MTGCSGIQVTKPTLPIKRVKYIRKGGMMKGFYIVLVGILAFAGCKEIQEEIEQCTVSGKVTNGGQALANTYVLLLKSKEGDISLSNGWKAGDDGTYKIIRVDPSTYYVTAIADTNGNIIYEPDKDLIGWYDPDDNSEPDSIVVNEEDDLTGIDIDTLYIAP